jgi:hypothetical protein
VAGRDQGPSDLGRTKDQALRTKDYDGRASRP